MATMKKDGDGSATNDKQEGQISPLDSAHIKIICFCCRREGHTKRCCPLRMGWLNGGGEEGEQGIFAISPANEGGGVTDPSGVSTSLSRSPFTALTAVENILGYHFQEPNLIHQAMTHSSFSYYTDKANFYGRLAYMGNTALNCLFARELFNCSPPLPACYLTSLRQANANRERLARVVMKYGLHKFLLHRIPLFDTRVEDFSKAISNQFIQSPGQINAPKFLADIIESIFGAIFIDSNYCFDTLLKISKRLMDPFITMDALVEHPVTKLTKLCDMSHFELKFIDSWDESKIVSISVEGQMLGSAKHKNSKVIAYNRAAKIALDTFNGFCVKMSER